MIERRVIKKVLITLVKSSIILAKHIHNFTSVSVLVCPCVSLCVVECYAVLHLPVVEMEGDMAGCSLSEEGEC